MNSMLARFICLSAVLAIPAHGAVLYKLTDAKGAVSYVEVPPQGFHGRVEAMSIETNVNVIDAPARTKPMVTASVPASEAPTAPKMDYLSKRRATRDQLEARLQLARRNLDAAKEALAHPPMDDDETRFALRRIKTDGNGQPARGELATRVMPDNRMCAGAMQNGHAVHRCGLAVNESFMAKANALEAAVKQAEEEVAEAEIAYRRGVD
jgi:hypothetical protein